MASCCQGGSSHTYTTMYSQTARTDGKQMQTPRKLLALVMKEGSNIKMTGKTTDPRLRLMNADRGTCSLAAWIRALCQSADAQPLQCCRQVQLTELTCALRGFSAWCRTRLRQRTADCCTSCQDMPLAKKNSHVWLLWQQLVRVQQAAQGSCALQPLPIRAMCLQFCILLSLLKLVVWLLKGIQNCLHNMLPGWRTFCCQSI